MNYSEEIETILTHPISPILQSKDGDYYLYGGGSLGQLAIDLILVAGYKKPKFIIDKSKTGDIKGIKIIPPEQVESKNKELLCVVCIATLSFNMICDELRNNGIGNITHFYPWITSKFPFLLNNGWTCCFPNNETKQNILKTIEMLSHDETSVHHYLQFLWWRLRGVEKLYDEFPVLEGKKYFFSPCLSKLTDQETLLYCGAHYGQAIGQFIGVTNNRFKNIFAFEPDAENLQICKQKYQDSRINYYCCALSDESGRQSFSSGLGFASKLQSVGKETVPVKKIDDIEISPSLIINHTEGEELRVLLGGVNTIKKCKPQIMVLADHCVDGLYAIPFFLDNLGYKVFFNLHDYCGNTAIYYGIPY